MDELHQEAVRETTTNKISVDTKRNYRNRLKEIIKFWKASCPEHCEEGVRELTPEDLANRDCFWHKNTFDVICTGLNVKFVLAFMAVKKKKESGKTSSFSNIQKINDAILF